MSLKTLKIRFNQAAEISNDRVVPNRVDLSALSGAVSDRYCVASSTKIELSLFPPSLSPSPSSIIVTVTVIVPKSGEPIPLMIRTVRDHRVLENDTISTRRVNRRDAIMTGGRYCARGEREREKNRLDRHFGGRRYGEFAACEPYRVSTIGRPLGCRQIYPEFPCRISRAPSSDAVIRTTVLSVAGMGWSGEKKMICRGYLFIFFFIYNYVLNIRFRL